MRMNKYSFLSSIVFMVVCVMSCGKKSDQSSSSPAPTPTPTPTVVEAPESPAVSFWIASNPKDGGGPIAVRFDSAGRLALTVDLMLSAGLDYGPITAFHFLDASTLMFFVDPGAGKETIGTMDVKSALVKNKAWGSRDSIKAALNGARANSMVTGLQSGVLYVQTPTSVKSIRYNADGGLGAVDFYSSDVAAVSACPIGTLTSSALVNGGDGASLAVLSTGTATRINILNVQQGEVNCKSSLDYSQGPYTTAQHKAVNILQNSDGKVYVLYQHDSAPLLIRYDFDGTTLSNPFRVYAGTSNMGKTPLGMIARTNKRLLIGRPDVASLIEIQLKPTGGEQTDLYLSTAFAKDLTALIAEPNQ